MPLSQRSIFPDCCSRFFTHQPLFLRFVHACSKHLKQSPCLLFGDKLLGLSMLSFCTEGCRVLTGMAGDGDDGVWGQMGMRMSVDGDGTVGDGDKFDGDGCGWVQIPLMQVRNDEICPLCQEEEETTVHLLGKCCALINQRLETLGSHYLEYEDLALLHWRPLMRLAKASKRF